MYLLIFRIILIIILYFIFYIGYIYFDFGSWWIKELGKVLFKLLNVRNVKVNNLKTFNDIYKSNKKCLIIANHKTLIDVWVTSSVLQNVGYFGSIEGGTLIPGLYEINKKIKTLFINKEKSGTQQLIENITNRKPYDNLIVVYADAMEPIQPGFSIANFKTGGFVGKFDILPIVIKYKNYDIDPVFKWYNGEDIYSNLTKIIIDGKCEIIVDIMNLQECDENMSIDEYKNKIYELMNKRYDEL